MNVVVLLTGAQMQNLRPPKPLTPPGLCAGVVWYRLTFEFFLYFKLHMALLLLLFWTDKLVKIKQTFFPLAFIPSLSTYFLLGLFLHPEPPLTNGGVLVIC